MIIFFEKSTKRSSAIKTIDPFSDSDTETDLNKARITNRIRNIKKSVDHMKNDNSFGKVTQGLSAIKTVIPFNDSDTETDVESACECNENKKDKMENTLLIILQERVIKLVRNFLQERLTKQVSMHTSNQKGWLQKSFKN